MCKPMHTHGCVECVCLENYVHTCMFRTQTQTRTRFWIGLAGSGRSVNSDFVFPRSKTHASPLAWGFFYFRAEHRTDTKPTSVETALQETPTECEKLSQTYS